MNYWLDLFTGTTWKEFLAAGGTLSGFSERKRTSVAKIQPGDILLCYLTGVMRWIGALEVVGPSSDRRKIWKDVDFPIRIEVKPLVTLEPEHGIPMTELRGKVAFYTNQKMHGKFNGFLRGSPTKFSRLEDGELILKLLRNAETAPISRPVDAKKLARKPIYKVQRAAGGAQVAVTVPEPEEDLKRPRPKPQESVDDEATSTTRHTEIQYELLILGAEMGLDVWVARNDRSRLWKEQRLGDLPRIISALPTQFNDATTRTIELIDVLWLKGKSIVAAFEVECTTSIYSGLLRMSDLLALQPNLDIDLYLVAPDDRRDKVAQEIRRPTFSLSEKPLPQLCGFLGFGKLTETVTGIRKLNLATSLQPSFLQKTAEYFAVEEGE